MFAAEGILSSLILPSSPLSWARQKVQLFGWRFFLGRGDPTTHFAVLSKGNRVKIPEPGRKDKIEVTRTNSEKSAEAPGRVLFSF